MSGPPMRFGRARNHNQIRMTIVISALSFLVMRGHAYSHPEPVNCSELQSGAAQPEASPDGPVCILLHGAIQDASMRFGM